MGRTLAAILCLGLLAAGGWFVRGKVAGGRASDAAAGTGATAVLPVAASALAAGERNPGASPRRSVPEEEGIRALLRAGNSREAVRKARSLSRESLRDPGVAEAAKDAASSVADGSASGPADRLAAADDARRLLARLAVEDAAPLAAVGDRLDRLNREVLFSGRDVPGALFRHAVRPGDTLDRLMRTDWKGRVRSGYGAVLWVNSIPSPDRLRATTISVPEESVRLLVRKHEHVLWLLLGEVPVRSFPVGLGMNGRTPEGMFDVEEMMPRPDYWPPGGKRVPFGQKGNPLGTRWMGFRDTPDAQGYGIHGTDDPSSVGKDLSQGCVRLANSDVEQLFTWVVVGTRVEIRP
jgi:hypothetical protein